MTDTPTVSPAQENIPDATSQTGFWHEVRSYLEALLVAFVIVTFLFNTVGVVGNSMRPNLNGGGGEGVFESILTGDRVFIPKFETWLRRLGVMGEYRRGDIVVVREPPNSPHAQLETTCFLPAKLLYECRPFFIKRVIGVPGDHLHVQGGEVTINGQKIDQSYITASGEIRPERLDFPVVTQNGGKVNGFSASFEQRGDAILPAYLPVTGFYPQPLRLEDAGIQLYYGKTVEALAPVPDNAPENVPFILDLVVPEDHYFVLGDNRTRGGSEDSKYFGPVPGLSISGRASAVIWPPRRGDSWNWRLLTPPEAFEAVSKAPVLP